MKKYLLFALALLISSCSEKDESISSTNSRKPDPIDGASGQIVYAAPTNWNVVSDTLTDCGSVFLNWTAQPGADRYYVLFEGTGNGSCSINVTISGITYFYPWTYTPVNYRALQIGSVCGTLPHSNYNIIILYYKFKQGKWNGYSSLPVAIRFNRAGWECRVR